MRKWMIISLLIMMISAIASVTYAWFTYVQRKSLVQLTSNDIDALLTLNDEFITTSFEIKGLTYIDFEKEVMISTVSDGFNEVGKNYTLKISVSETSPIMKVLLELSSVHPELIILWIDEGIMTSDMTYTTDYLSYIKSLAIDSTTKDEFMLTIGKNNQEVLENLSIKELRPGDTYVLQLIVWADYNALPPEDDYLTKSYDISLDFYMISGKGEFNE